MRPEALGVTRPEGTEGSFELVAIGALERLLSGGVNLAGCECNIQYIGGHWTLMRSVNHPHDGQLHSRRIFAHFGDRGKTGRVRAR